MERMSFSMKTNEEFYESVRQKSQTALNRRKRNKAIISSCVAAVVILGTAWGVGSIRSVPTSKPGNSTLMQTSVIEAVTDETESVTFTTTQESKKSFLIEEETAGNVEAVSEKSVSDYEKGETQDEKKAPISEEKTEKSRTIVRAELARTELSAESATAAKSDDSCFNEEEERRRVDYAASAIPENDRKSLNYSESKTIGMYGDETGEEYLVIYLDCGENKYEVTVQAALNFVVKTEKK